MSHISKISIKNYRGIKELTHEFGDEKFIVLIGRGDSGKSTILSAINVALSPSWNLSFSDLDFYNQDISQPIEIELTIKELPPVLLKESKFGFYLQNDLNEDCKPGKESIILKFSVDITLEPHWVLKARPETNIEDKAISGADRALFAANFIADYTDNQFAYNRQSPLYALTKASLTDGGAIEHVKADLIRTMASSIDKDKLNHLNTPLASLKQTAEMLGLNVNDLCAQVDIKENPYTGNSIALHDDKLPYRLHGKGSKRLMSIAIQAELTKQGGIVLVDELEQGLEPDRIVTLTRILKQTSSGQVFITTHSLNVVLEAEYNNLFVVCRGSNSLNVIGKELDSFRRTNPQVFFAKKIICCEGKTEVGFIRAIDSWIRKKHNTSLSAKGVVIVDSKGGNQMYTFARKLFDIGYKTCVFADDDKSEELTVEKHLTDEKGIKLFLCDKGNCFEKQIINDLPWKFIANIVQCSQVNFPYNNINLPDGFIERIMGANDERSQIEIRNEIIVYSIQKKKEWFKHIPGGEFLGDVFIEAFDDMMDDTNLKKNVVSLLKWCDILE